jgi:membrane-bound lytic murein transglycosylase B
MRWLAVVLGLFALSQQGAAQAPQAPPNGVPEGAPAAPAQPFDEWLGALIAEARGRGFSNELVDETLTGLEPLHRVIASDRSQAELNPGFNRYYTNHVSRAMVRRGRALSEEHADLLRRIETRYNVQRRFLLAVWGMESRFGRIQGRTPVFQALATLAWEPRRAPYFRSELFHALRIVADGHIDASSMRGSWAGAMGQPQFMPSSYLAYAVDFDGDSRRDIWTSYADTFASIANYLKEHGWQAGESWGREVSMSRAVARRTARAVKPRGDGCRAMRAMSSPAGMTTWRRLGVRSVDGDTLTMTAPDAALVRAGQRGFLVHANYDVVLRYNCHHHYALTVALLADRITERP